MVKANVLEPLCELLKSTDSNLLKVVLEAIENILKAGQEHASKTGANPYVDLIEQFGGDQQLIELQNVKNKDVYTKAQNILEDFFDVQADDMENTEPNNMGSTFNFNAPRTNDIIF
ncbi:hypothetical protein SAMD00019534_063060, partial [Acytostelium subglobosum LB1]|uniref:hypothetical protein n=1 Tax=Acytostelium subglobosum LB1 TaxID=1410327 RepID=UPI000644A903